MNTDIKYFIYARKSSESSEKQIQSIGDQVLIMNGIAKSYGLTVVDTITEAKSAKEPRGRPEFEKMLKRIKKGEAEGILVWKTDRLFRNPIDSAEIQWMLQRGTIAVIKTPDKEYLPEDNILLLSIESGMANQYLRDLSKGVKRGQNSKLEKGWMPCTAPLGYLNTKIHPRGENYITTDPERFPLIRKAWKLMLTGNYVPTEILAKLNNEWGFRTRKWKQRGGNPLSRSGIYKIFNNPFYTGIIPYKGKLIPGKHKAMITMEEFEQVQFLLGKNGKRRPQRYAYPYTGLLGCEECGGFVSATFKQKFIKSEGKLKDYILYYCTCARRRPQNCSQRPYTNQETIDEAIEKELASLTLMPEFEAWAINILEENKDNEKSDQEQIQSHKQATIDATQKQIVNLNQMRLKDMIDDDEYTKEKNRLKKELVVLEKKMGDMKTETSKQITFTKETFHFACYAHAKFLNGDTKTKREILSGLCCLNQTIKDKKATIVAAEWFKPIKNEGQSLQARLKAFEPDKYGSTEWEKAAFAAFSPELRE